MKLIMESWRRYIAESTGFGEGMPPADTIYKKQVVQLEEEEGEEPEEAGPDWLGLLLDAFGFIPGFGEPIDAIQAYRHIKRKEYFYALLSIISMVPEIGDVLGKGTKYLGKGGAMLAKLFKSSDRAAKVTRVTAKTVSTVAQLSELLGSDNAKRIANFVKKHNRLIRLAAHTIGKHKEEKSAMAETTISVHTANTEESAGTDDHLTGFFRFLDDLESLADPDILEEPEEAIELEVELPEDEEYFV